MALVQPSGKIDKNLTPESAPGIRIDSGPFVGVVKSNIDASRSGALAVWIPELGGKPEDPSNWRTVRYASPFFGVTPRDIKAKGQGFVPDSPHSYGMWFVPPDVENRVICTFIGGDPNRGYWFACIPEWPNFHMVPGISSGKWHGGGPEPLVDFNDQADGAESTKSEFYKRAVTPHDYQKQVWARQGLLQDPDRGPGNSSAFRETPSRVFGISTPGPELQLPSGEENQHAKMEVTGRQGGHQFVMDDGDINGNSQLIRLRTSNGNMLLMNDSAGFIYLINSQGSAWFEMDKTGNVRIFSQAKIEMHATAGFCFETPTSFTVSAGTINLSSKGPVKISGATADLMGMGGVKVGGPGDLHLSGKKSYLSGKSCVGISGGAHIDMKAGCITLNTKKVTEASAPSPAMPCQGPTHEPYGGHQAGRTNSPVSSAGSGATNGVPEGNSGTYGAAGSFGITPRTPGYYGAYTNATGPIKFNPGLQGSYEGQAANQGTTALLNQYDRNSILYTNVNIKLPFATGGFAVNVRDPEVARVTDLTLGERQNNPGDLTGLEEDPFAIGITNGLNVYASPEDGIAALSLALDLIQADGANTVEEIIQGYVQRKGNVI